MTETVGPAGAAGPPAGSAAGSATGPVAGPADGPATAPGTAAGGRRATPAARVWRQPVVRIAARRIALMVPTALLATIMTFLLVHLIPGGPAEARLGVNATAGSVAAIKHQLGLDKPLVSQYWSWLTGVLHGNLGVSLQTNQSVSSGLSTRLPVTLELVVLATLLTVIFAVPAGVLAAERAGSRTDTVIRGGSGIGLAIPDFFLAIVLIDVLAVALHLLPELGYVRLTTDLGLNLQHLVLPALALGAGAGAIVVRQVRAAMIDALDQDWVRTARAMGIREGVIVWRYALRNAMSTVLTVYGLLVVGMLGATVILEQVFVLPGLGGSVITAIDNRDYTVLQGTVLVYVVIVLVINLVVDVAVGLVNPRAAEEAR